MVGQSRILIFSIFVNNFTKKRIMSLNYEFSKNEKKIVRQVIETALQRDFETSILDLDYIIQRWKIKELDNRAAYRELYSKVKTNDKYIARMYDDVRGSTYMLTLQGLLANKVITEDDLGDFSEKTRNDILGIREILQDG